MLPLHSGVSNSKQLRVLEHSPKGVRKIALSTNIARTLLTLIMLRTLWILGERKRKSYDADIKARTLQNVWVSATAAKQRKGRAGRVKNGICRRLFSRERRESMQAFTESELLRTPLVSAVAELDELCELLL